MHTTIQDRIAEGLRERILSGKLKPGERLRQTEIAKQFNASHIPVREALRQLNAEGLVSIESHRGAIVASLSHNELEEIIRLRQILEVELLSQAIPKMTEADITRSQKALDVLRANRNARSYGARNWAFHESLYKPADAPLTLSLVERLHQLGQRYFELEHNLDEVNDEHQTMLEFAAKGDVEKGAKLLRRHIGQLDSRVRLPKDFTAPAKRRAS